MTTQTTVNAIEMVKAAGLKEAGEIRLFLMETREVTIARISEAIVELGYALPEEKRPKKIVVADLLARALEMDFGTEEILEEQSAAEDRPVAEENKTEEEVDMKKTSAEVQQELQRIINEKNLKALLASPISKGDSIDFAKGHTAYENTALKDMLVKVNSAKDKYVENVAAHEVVLDEIVFYAEDKKEATHEQRRNKEIVREYDIKEGAWKGGKVRIIGDVTVQLPEGYAQIKVWNPKKVNSKGKLGAPEFAPFVGMDLNVAKRQYNMFRGAAKGSGFLVLPIMEFVNPEGEVTPMSVSLPVEKAKNGSKYDIFRTSDARFIKTKDAVEVDEPLYLSDNNANFNAAVTAYVQMYSREFKKADVANNHSYKKDSCQNMVRFQTRDGVMDDMDAESKKSRVILEQPDVMQLAQVGSEQPNTYCMVHDFFIDMEAVEILNDAEKLEKGNEGRNDDGDVRFQRHDEILVAGKLVKRNTVRQSIIEKVCGACPNYCGNTPKSQARITKERIAAIEAGDAKPYISPFFREKAKPEAQVVQTLTEVGGMEKWVSKFPQEILKEGGTVLDMRVKTAGMIVYGSDNIELEVDYKVPTEKFDARHAAVMKQINHIFYAAFNYSKLDVTQVKIVNELCVNKPEGITSDEETRWDDAVNWYKQAIQWDLERQAIRTVASFTTKFHIGLEKVYSRVATNILIDDKPAVLVRPVGTVEIHVEDIMGETMKRAEEGTIGYGLGYEDLAPAEFTRYLDEVAMDYVYEVILNGTNYSVVGGTDKDKELAAGALQQLLQKELTGNFYAFANGDYRDNSFATSIRRDADPKAALAALKVCDEVKAYLGNITGANK
jgi:hypothetical protein